MKKKKNSLIFSFKQKRNKNKAESVNNTNNNTITSNEIAKPVLAYKAVSMSPFKNQEKKEFINTSNNSQSNSNNSNTNEHLNINYIEENFKKLTHL